MKAMLLAAGLGKRLQPLTLTTPKPLVRIGNTTLIDHALTALSNAGIQEVVINVHHLRDQIIQHCGNGSAYDLQIHYSIEETLLETGGGILQALPLLGDQPFLVMSADIWCDYPLKNLTTLKTENAHLVFVDNPPYHPNGDYGLDQNGIVKIQANKKFTYANIGILHPRLLNEEKTGVFKLSRIFEKNIRENKITGEHYSGNWFNVGTMSDIELLENYLLSKNGLTRSFGNGLEK